MASNELPREVVERLYREAALILIIRNIKKQPAPIKTERFGEHIEFIIGIGKDNHASISMTKEAYNELFKGGVETPIAEENQ